MLLRLRYLTSLILLKKRLTLNRSLLANPSTILSALTRLTNSTASKPFLPLAPSVSIVPRLAVRSARVLKQVPIVLTKERTNTLLFLKPTERRLAAGTKERLTAFLKSVPVEDSPVIVEDKLCPLTSVRIVIGLLVVLATLKNIFLSFILTLHNRIFRHRLPVTRESFGQVGDFQYCS